jgi:DNA-binding MurR/RpiR family transcriptional regulator
MGANGGTSGGGLREVTAAVADGYDRLSPGQRRVIDRLLADTRLGAVISAAELAREAGVSESTVTRAAQTLGFAGYPDLQARLRERFLDPAAVPARVEAGLAGLGDTPEAAALRVMLEDAENIRATAEDLHPETLRAAVDRLVAARRVYVFGTRGSYGLAAILSLGFRLILPDVRLLNQTVGDLADQLVPLCADDAVIVISFRRVDRVTLVVLRHAAKVGASRIALTDGLSNPIARLTDLALIARVGPLRLLPPYAPGASLVNALLTAVSLRTHVEAAPRLQTAERLWKEFDLHAER